MAKSKNDLRMVRKVRVRRKISGTDSKPRLSVFKSLKYVYAQLIDDFNGKTLVSANSLDMKKGGGGRLGAQKVGQMIAERAKNQNISEVTFDRSGYLYHGVIKALADAAREGGLKF